ncbi:MAG TPA: RraA family protein [Clostridia bacterium]|nr:RraA family protein [Clostridia bacterium]
MKLEDLKKMRQGDADYEFPIPTQELVERYEAVFTAAVNDVLREMGYVYQTLPNTIQGLSPDMKVAGIAFTLKGSKNLDIVDEMPERARMLDAIPKDAVCVWDTSNDDESAQWGEIMTMAAKMRGARGAIVDGGVRDTDRVLQQRFPVFARFRSSNGMLGRFRMIGYQVPIRVGEVAIHPGDVLLGDIDGVIVVPRKLAYDVLLKAEYIRDNEVEIKKMVLSGLKAVDIVDRGGYF